MSEQVSALTTTSLQSAIAAQQSSSGPVVLAPTSTSSLTSAFAAITSLTSSTPTSVSIDLSNTSIYAQFDSSGNVVPLTVSAPANVTLTITCPSGGATVYDLKTSGNVSVHGTPGSGIITIVGNSPALTVGSGNVTLGPGVTLITTTNSPTIVVSGGSLKLRGVVVQGSTTYAQPAIRITGGSVDLGASSADPGNNTIIAGAAGELMHNSTGAIVPAFGDTFEEEIVQVRASIQVTLHIRAAPPKAGWPR